MKDGLYFKVLFVKDGASYEGKPIPAGEFMEYVSTKVIETTFDELHKRTFGEKKDA